LIRHKITTCGGVGSFTFAESIRQFGINGLGFLTECFADPEKLHHIQPPLAVFNPPDERIFTIQFFG
jgi:hypothetical protein